MATFGPQQATSAGIVPTYNVLTSGGDKVAPGTLLHFKNTNGVARNVTIASTGLVDGDLAVADRVVNVPATTGDKFVRIPADETYRGTDGLVTLTYDVNPPAGLVMAVLS